MKHLDEFEDYIDFDSYIIDESLSSVFKKSIKAKADIKLLKRKARNRVEILKKNELAKQKQARMAQSAKKDKGSKVISINRKQAA